MQLEKFEEHVENSEMFVNAHYYKRLIKILEWSIEQYKAYKKKQDGRELHHIIPRSWGGSNERRNLVSLPYRIHFIVHRLMYKSFPKNKEMLCAFYMMHNVNGSKISSKEYKNLKEQFIKMLKDGYASGEIISQFKNSKLVREITSGKIIWVDKHTFDIGDSHVCITKGRKNSPEAIEEMKKRFIDGGQVSHRKNKVMARNTITGEAKLIDRETFYSEDNYIGIGAGAKRSEAHRKIISERMKVLPKTDIQKQSARMLIGKLAKNKIKCECCDRSFDIGNYTKHIKGITQRGTKHSTETRERMSKSKKDSNEKNGSYKGIYLITVDLNQYITYDFQLVLTHFDISRPTGRRRFKIIKIGINRNRKIISIDEDVDLSLYKIFEDEYITTMIV